MSSAETGPLGEFDLIARFFAPLARHREGAFSLTDDGALIDDMPPATTMVATMDTLVEGVHFLPASSPETVARKLVGVNLSDLAAMGAQPHSALLSLVLPKRIDASWLESFAGALQGMQDEYCFAVIGGDTLSSPGPLTVSLCALGYVAPGRALRRSAARAGDIVCVCGTIGDGALGLIAARGGLARLGDEDRAYLIERYNHPRPRIVLGRLLADLDPAFMGGVCDISDGLLADLGHIGEQSDVCFEIDATRIPLSGAARRALAHDPSLIETVLSGGDDYELVFTLRDESRNLVDAISRKANLAIHVIGDACGDPRSDGVPEDGRRPGGDGARVIAYDGTGGRIRVAHPGYSHF